MANCSVAGCDKKAIAGYAHDDIIKSVTRWCRFHEAELKSKVFAPGRWLNREEVDRT
jgi:hypothetical protein